MGVIENAIEFICEAACNKVFAEDNYIEKKATKITAWKQGFGGTECT